MSDTQYSPNDDSITIVGGTVAATQGTTPWVVAISQTGSNNDVDVISSALPAGASTSSLQTTGNTSLSSIDSKLTDTVNGLKVDGSGVTQPISGSVSVSNFPGTQPVSGTVTANAGTGNFNVVQSTGSNLHVAVDNFPATQPISGSVSVSNFPATQPVSGTVTANAGTGNFTVVQSTAANLNATVTGSVSVSNFPATQPVSGTITANAGTGTFTVDRLTRQTYGCVKNGIVPDTAATDIFTIFGSGTKTIKVHRIQVSATQTTVGIVPFSLIVRSSANSGGTSAAETAVPYDSNNNAATATVTSYSANPTVGTTVGKIKSVRLFTPASTTTSSDEVYTPTFGDDFTQPVTLRGTSQGLCFSLGATTVAGGAFNVSVEWTEE